MPSQTDIHSNLRAANRKPWEKCREVRLKKEVAVSLPYIKMLLSKHVLASKQHGCLTTLRHSSTAKVWTEVIEKTSLLQNMWPVVSVTAVLRLSWGDGVGCFHTGWSLALMCYHWRSGLHQLSLLSSTQQALPVSSTLTPGCHQRLSVAANRKYLWNCQKAVRLLRLYPQISDRPALNTSTECNTWFTHCYEPVWQYISLPLCLKNRLHDPKNILSSVY